MNVPKQFLVYGLGGAASRFAAILLVPLYTRALSIDQFGKLEVLLALHAVAILLAGMQSESAVARDYFDASEKGTLRDLKWGSVAISLAGTLLLAIAGYIALAFGLLPEGSARYFPWLLAMTVPAQLLGIQLVILRFAGSPVFFAFLSFLDLSLSALASALLILVFDQGVVGALAGITIAKSISVLLAWNSTFASPREARPSRGLIRSMLAYALPTMPAVLLNWLQTNGTRVLLALFLTLQDVAIAAIAIKVAALYGFLTYSFRLAWEPYAFQKLDSVDADPAVYNRAFEWYVVAMFLAAGLAAVASPLLVPVLAPPSYSGAIELAGAFILGQFWVGAISILSIGIHGARITSRLTVVYGAGAVLNVLLLGALAGWIGVTAAAVGFAASSMLSALLALHYSERHFSTGFDHRLTIVALCSGTAFAVLTNRLYASISWTDASAGQYILISAFEIFALAAAMGVIAWFGIGRERFEDMWNEVTGLVRARV